MSGSTELNYIANKNVNVVETKEMISPEKKHEKSMGGVDQSLEEFSVNKLDKEEIIEHLAIIVEQPISDSISKEVKSLKQAFYRLKGFETEASDKTFRNAGAIVNLRKEEKDATEERLKELLAIFREKKSLLIADIERIKGQNLIAKKAIVERIKEFVNHNQDNQNNFHEVYNEFKELQRQWKEITQIPQGVLNDLWKEYQYWVEQFYDLLKINTAMRDYDFQKNLELKQRLCEMVERLNEEPDVVSAFHQLQRFHRKWKEVGPVAREYRADIWERFKQASSVITTKHQKHFEELKELEQQGLKEKNALCEKLENIDYSSLVSFKEWEEKTKYVLEIQNQWKMINFVSKKSKKQLSDRFQMACDVFFRTKNNFYKGLHETLDANLRKKESICAEAEFLKNSQEWKQTADRLIVLQKEWKSIGVVSRKHSDVLWKRFLEACNYFFKCKNAYFSSQKNEEIKNLENKKEIISNIKAIDKALSASEVMDHLHKYMAQFNDIGFVPFSEKDKIRNEYRKAVDSIFEYFKMGNPAKYLQSFNSDLNVRLAVNVESQSGNKILNSRFKLIRDREKLKNDIQNYENNISFLSVSSKNGSNLVQEIQRKMEHLKSTLTLVEEKIKTIDQRIES